MKVLSSGMKALSKLVKGNDFLLLCLVLILVAIGGTTIGLSEEIVSFYPILMPIFLKNKNFDGILSMAPLYLGTICGNMFSTISPYSVVIASNIAGINFIDGIGLRIVGLIFSIVITIFYLWVYYARIRLDERLSITYEIKDQIKQHNHVFEHKKKREEEDIIDDVNGSETDNKDKIEQIKKDEEDIIKDEQDNKKEYEKINNEEGERMSKKSVGNSSISIHKDGTEKMDLNLRQIIYFIIFLSGILLLILGVSLLGWTILQMSEFFLP